MTELKIGDVVRVTNHYELNDKIGRIVPAGAYQLEGEVTVHLDEGGGIDYLRPVNLEVVSTDSEWRKSLVQRAYIAGPMRGIIPDSNFPYFFEVAADLESKGYAVFNPAAGPDGAWDEQGLSLNEYMERDLAELCRCDLLVMLPGWQDSQGALLEAKVAHHLDMPVVIYPEMAPFRHPNSARFHEHLDAAGRLHDMKQADYGRGKDPFANVRSSEEWGINGWVGAMVRLNDKVRRLQSLSTKGSLINEAATDSFMDIAVYALIALVLFEETQNA